MAINRRPFILKSYKIRDDDTVSEECQRRNITFCKYEYDDGDKLFLPPLDESEEVNVTSVLKQTNLSLEVNLFRCPITKMDLKFVRSWIPIKIFDLYITAGKNDLTVAVLQDSTMDDNVCVIDMYLYSGNDDIKNRGLHLKP